VTKAERLVVGPCVLTELDHLLTTRIGGHIVAPPKWRKPSLRVIPGRG
jgi:hypothetical protein